MRLSSRKVLIPLTSLGAFLIALLAGACVISIKRR